MSEHARDFLQQLRHLYYDGPGILEKFIVIEGLDGSGSSTQAQMLEQYWQGLGMPCDRSTEPSAGLIGQHIRSVLQDSAAVEERSKLAEYFAADRAEHIWGLDGIEAKTKVGVYCVSERYLFSSLVYQGLDEYCQLPLAKIWDLNRKFPLPQHFFYLDIAVDIAEQRIHCRGQKREIFEQQDFLLRIRQAYQALLGQLQNMNLAMQVHQLDASQEAGVIHHQILECMRHDG